MFPIKTTIQSVLYPPDDYLVTVGKAWYDVYIGRNPKYGSTEWGNPFIIGKDGTRDEVIEKYRKWIFTQESLMHNLQFLRHKILGCHCWPEHRCHGEVLLDLMWDRT